MEIDELKKQSDRSFETALAKQNALEKARSRMVFAYDGHLFLANAETINLVNAMSDRDTFVLLDTNDNPALIDDPTAFLSKLIERNQEVLNSYHQIYLELQKLR